MTSTKPQEHLCDTCLYGTCAGCSVTRPRPPRNHHHTEPQGVLWVCIDCMITREHGEVPPDRPADLPEVWSLLTDTEVTLGMAWARHAEDCPNRDAGISRDADCDCERDEFSTRACDACGDTHHGERRAYTWWA